MESLLLHASAVRMVRSNYYARILPADVRRIFLLASSIYIRWNVPALVCFIKIR